MNKCWALALLLGAASISYADDTSSTITKILVSYNASGAPATIDIYGTGFGTVKPTVSIDGISPAVTLYTATHVTATAPALPAGTYLLTLTPNSKSSSGDDSKKSVSFPVSINASIASFLAGKSCPSGYYLAGFDSSASLQCTPLSQSAPAPAPPPPGGGGSPAPAPPPSPVP